MREWFDAQFIAGDPCERLGQALALVDPPARHAPRALRRGVRAEAEQRPLIAVPSRYWKVSSTNVAGFAG